MEEMEVHLLKVHKVTAVVAVEVLAHVELILQMVNLNQVIVVLLVQEDQEVVADLELQTLVIFQTGILEHYSGQNN